jgi:KaiC/GvpD/RAD55 family RecA-like ATPase
MSKESRPARRLPNNHPPLTIAQTEVVEDVDFAPELPDARRLALRTIADVQARNVAWLVQGLIPRRTLTTVAGVGGLGKSTWLTARAAEVSRGDQLGEPAEVIIVTFEDAAEEVLRPRLQAAGADLERVHMVVVEAASGIDPVRLPPDIDELERLVTEVKAKLVVVDPIVAAIDTAFDAHKDQHVRSVLARLVEIAESADCAIVLVAHLNKAPSTDAYIRVGGSVAFYNASRSVVLVTADPEDPESLRLLSQQKANYSRLHPVERHRIDEVILPDTFDPDTGDPIVTSRMVFVQIAEDVDGADVLAPEKPTKVATAESLLEVLLRDGEWRESDELKKVLAAAGFNDRLAQRAAKDLGVDYDRRGFPSVTWWRLPVATSLAPRNVATVDTAQPSHFSPESVAVATTLGDVATGNGYGSPADALERAHRFDEMYPPTKKRPWTATS